jgi:threonine-phosphate decarboxylase
MSIHGGNLREAEELYGRRHFLDFSANINPYGLPGKVKDALLRCIEEEMSCYPDPACRASRQVLAAYHGLAEENVLCGNGASEILSLVFQGLRPQKVLAPIPSFCEYIQYALRSGARILSCPTRMEGQFQPDLEELARRAQEADAVILGNPNNPTSVLIPPEKLKELAQRIAPRVLIVDEAFIELTLAGEGNSLTPYLKELPNLLIVRALTKSLAIPALRMGYALAAPELLQKLEACQVTWSVNALAQAAARCMGELDCYRQRMGEWLERELPYAYGRMSAIRGMRCFQPNTNFMLAKAPFDARKLREALARQGILIRCCGNFEGLDDTYFRVAIRERQENQLLYEALEQAAAQIH